MGYKKKCEFPVELRTGLTAAGWWRNKYCSLLRNKERKRAKLTMMTLLIPLPDEFTYFYEDKKRTLGKRVCRWDYFCCSFFVGLKCLQRSCCQKVTEGLKWKGTLPFSFAFFSRVPPFSLALVSFDQVETYIAPPSAATLERHGIRWWSLKFPKKKHTHTALL